MTITHILACECGDEIACAPEAMRLGEVYRCRACRVIWGCVRPHRGGKAWIRIDRREAHFHRLVPGLRAPKIRPMQPDKTVNLK
jgi:hypothetical protein